MVDVRSIPRKAAAARAQARNYWLAALVCFFMQLFPVISVSDELLVEPALQSKLVFVASDVARQDDTRSALPQADKPCLYYNVEKKKFAQVRTALPEGAVICPYLATGPPGSL